MVGHKLKLVNVTCVSISKQNSMVLLIRGATIKLMIVLTSLHKKGMLPKVSQGGYQNPPPAVYKQANRVV